MPDIQRLIAEAIDEKQFPSTNYYFESTKTAIDDDSATVEVVGTGRSDANVQENKWLHIVENMLTEANNRYNNLAADRDNLAIEKETLEATASQLQTEKEGMDAVGIELQGRVKELENQLVAARNQVADLNNRCTALRAEAASLTETMKDTLKETAAAARESAATANPNGGTSVMNLPHPTAFSGSDTNSAKRTSAFRTWRTQVTTRWNALPGQFYSEKQKILYATTVLTAVLTAVLTGAAHDGVMTGVETINKNPDDPDAEIRLRKLEQSGKSSAFRGSAGTTLPSTGTSSA